MANDKITDEIVNEATDTSATEMITPQTDTNDIVVKSENTNADSSYLAQTKVKSNDEIAWENYQAIKSGKVKTEDYYSTEEVAKRKGEFLIQELQKGVPYEQAAYEAGIGTKNLTEVSPLLDPVNIVTDLLTGGLTALPKAGAEVASTGLVRTVGSGLAEAGKDFGKMFMPSSYSKEIMVSSGKSALEMAGYGLMANAGISGAEHYTDNFVLQTVSGLTSSVVGASLLNAFKTGGVAALRGIAKNLRENNPDMASTFAHVADTYTETIPVNTVRGSGNTQVTSESGLIDNTLSSMQAANEIGSEVSQALNAGTLARDTTQELTQSVQENLRRANTARTDEERSYYLSEAFNNAFADAFRTPEEQRALSQVRDTINRHIGEGSALNENISAVRDAVGEAHGRIEAQNRDVSASELPGQGTVTETGHNQSGGIFEQNGSGEPQAVISGEHPAGDHSAGTPVGTEQTAGTQPLTRAGQDIPPNQRVYTPRLSLDEEGVNNLRRAVLDNDLTTVSNTIEYNLSKIGDGEELKQLIDKTFESVDLSQGTRSWDTAVSIAKDYGLDNLVKTFENTQHLDSRVYGSLVAMHSLGNAVKRLATEATVAMTPESITNAEHAITLFTQSLAMAKGMQTEVARSMSIMRKMRIGSSDLVDSVVQHLEQNGGLDLFRTKMEVLRNLGNSGNNQELMTGIVGSGYTRSRDAFIELMYSSMLSNPSTVEPVLGVNSISGTWALAQNMFERWLGSTWFGGNGISKAEFAEFKAGLWDAYKPRTNEEAINAERPLKALFDTLGLDIRDGKFAFGGILGTVTDASNIASSDAFRLAANAFRYNEGIIDSATKGLDEFGKAGALSSSALGIDGTLGKGLDYVFKVLGYGPRSLLLSDEFVKAGSYSAQYRALAARKAVGEGLTDTALEARISELVSNPDPELVKGAIDFARYLNVQTPVTGFTGGVMQAANKDAPLFKAVMFPFLRTAVNVFKYTAERTPGLGFLVESFRNDMFSGDPARKALALAKLESGTLMYMAGLGLVTSDIYTGPGPNDPEARKLWIEAGNMPHSIKIGDYQFPINRLDMISMPIIMLSEMINMPQAFDKTTQTGADMYATVMGTLYHLVSDKYYLKNFTALFDAMRDKSGSAMEKFVSGMTNPLVPLSSLNKTVTRANDGIIRDAWGWWENMKAQTPFNDVSGKRTILGEPVYYDPGKMQEGDWNGLFSWDGAFTMFSPVAGKTASNDPVYSEMIRLADKGFFNKQAIKDKIVFNGEAFKLEHEQNTQLMDILRFDKLIGGQTAKQHITSLIDSEGYKSLPSDLMRGEMLSHEVKSLHDIAIYKFAMNHPEMLGLSLDSKNMKVSRQLGLTEQKPVKRIQLESLKQ